MSIVIRIVACFLICLHCIVASAQNATFSDSTYRDEVVQFVRAIRNQNKWNERIVLIDEPDQIVVSNWQKRNLPEDSFFTKSDKEEIRQKFDQSKKYKWQYIYTGNSTIIDSSTLLSIFTDNTKKWWYFRSTYKVDYYFTFSAPIFLRNYTYCLFVYRIPCSGLCGMMRFYLYKKENRQWKILKKLDEADP